MSPNNSHDNLPIFETLEELEKGAQLTAKNAQAEFQHTAYLYTMARYLVALNEGRHHNIPIQVWNEYRNALDHLYRHLIGREGQVKKMEEHIQRAVLDAAKTYCHEADKRLAERISREDQECLRLVSNGTFYADLTRALNEAQSSFLGAKIFSLTKVA
jgi:hypothetical protein